MFYQKYNTTYLYAFSESQVQTSLDLSKFFDGSGSFFTYTGSLTTPNCFEVVQFVIMKEPLIVKESAVSNYKHLF